MALTFQSKNHKYQSIDPSDSIEWLSATSFIKLFKQPFDAVSQSEKSSKNKRSKWYGMDPAVIRQHWTDESERAMSAGTFYHDQRESDILELESIERQGRAIPIIRPIVQDGLKYAPEQRLTEGIYPEHFVYLKSAGICGQADRIEVVKDIVDVIDYKTNKKIEKESYKDWEGKYKMMTGPCAHLMDCNFNHYALQLSLYLYMILKHNPRYKPGKLVLHHIIFEKEGEDEFGNPLYKKNDKGEPMVKEVVPYELPYLKNEIRAMINWLHDNKDKIKK